MRRGALRSLSQGYSGGLHHKGAEASREQSGGEEDGEGESQRRVDGEADGLTRQQRAKLLVAAEDGVEGGALIANRELGKLVEREEGREHDDDEDVKSTTSPV